jgi:adenosine deaminase
MKISKDFIAEIPKTDLHLHLDGSLRLGTLIELARADGVALPSFTEEGLHELVFKDKYANLVEYLQGFAYTTAVMTNHDQVARVAYELAEDNYNEGVRYFEVRFAPQLHVTPTFPLDRVLVAVNDGLARATADYNQRLAALPAHERGPECHYGIIVCAMRNAMPALSPYFQDVFRVHAYSSDHAVGSMTSLEMARAAVDIRDRLGIPITGFDLAGAEAGYPAVEHRDAFDYCHKNFLKKTVHAGEAYGPESIFQAITDLHADRLGHGYYLLSPEKIVSRAIANPQDYVRRLSEYIADRRITIEVCLTSNMQTNPGITTLQDHAFGKMIKARLSTTLCTDNRLVSNTNVTREIQMAVDAFGIGPSELKDIIIYGFKRSFFPGSYNEKRQYVRSVIDHYEALERKHGIRHAPNT